MPTQHFPAVQMGISAQHPSHNRTSELEEDVEMPNSFYRQRTETQNKYRVTVDSQAEVGANSLTLRPTFLRLFHTLLPQADSDPCKTVVWSPKDCYPGVVSQPAL